jgi:hypothetical protein
VKSEIAKIILEAEELMAYFDEPLKINSGIAWLHIRNLILLTKKLIKEIKNGTI